MKRMCKIGIILTKEKREEKQEEQTECECNSFSKTLLFFLNRFKHMQIRVNAESAAFYRWARKKSSGTKVLNSKASAVHSELSSMC